MKRSELKSLIREALEEMSQNKFEDIDGKVKDNSLREEAVKNLEVSELMKRLLMAVGSEFKGGGESQAARRTLLLVMQELIKGDWHPARKSAAVAENKK